LAASDPLVLAIAADYEVDAHGRPVFNLDDIDGIASIIEETCGPFTRLRQRA
jgi:molybdopterin-guanine dinucleotide biosynthesis protein B